MVKEGFRIRTRVAVRVFAFREWMGQEKFSWDDPHDWYRVAHRAARYWYFLATKHSVVAVRVVGPHKMEREAGQLLPA